MRTVAVILLTGLTVVAGCQKKPETAAPDAGGSANSSSDQDRLQGVWMVESSDDGELQKGPDPSDGTRLQFKENQATLRERKDAGEVFTFTLDPSKDPKHLTLTHPDAPKRPGPTTATQEWIYKFDGDTLVVAFAGGDGPRPTEFKPRSWKSDPNKRDAGVIVLRLKKTNETPTELPKRSPPSNRPFTSK